MQIRRASENTARAVAAMLTAASGIAGAFPASAQQVAASQYGSETEAVFAHCNAIKDPARSAQCHSDAARDHVQARIKAADKRIAVAQAQGAAAVAEGDCAKALVEVAKKPAKQVLGREILAAAGRSVGQYGACKLLGELSQK